MLNPIYATRLGPAILALALLAACAAPSQTTLSDGTLAYRIDCQGTANGLNRCFEKAGKSCGASGYLIVDEDGGTISTSNAADSDTSVLVKEYETDRNSILIKCGS